MSQNALVHHKDKVPTAAAEPTTTFIHQTFPVTGMSCASCAASVGSILNDTSGVKDAAVNFANSSVRVEYSPKLSPADLQQAVRAAGYDLIIDTADPQDTQQRLQHQQYQKLKHRTIGSAVLAFLIVVLGMLAMDWPPGRWISLGLTLPVLGWFGRQFFVNAWKQVRHGAATMDTLVALSTGIAFLFSLFNTLYPSFWLQRGLMPHVYYEAVAVIVTFILLGKLLEERAKSSTSSAIKKLMGLQPKTLKIVRDGEEVELPIASVQVGDTVVVRPGEKIPADGKVSVGSSLVDESMISGEPMLVTKQVDDSVYAGTINQRGSFRFTAEKVSNETLLAHIIQQVQVAQGSKAPVQKLVDKIAGVFVPVVLAIAVLTFIIWMVTGGENAITHALLASVSVLVIACPCALGLATPTAIMVGIGRGAEHNILIKDAEGLELGYRVDAVVLDKTGTITQGRPQVTDMHWVDEPQSEGWKSTLLAMESLSEHPLALAIVSKLRTEGIQETFVNNFESMPGRGVQATDEHGDTYYIGNETLLVDKAISGIEFFALKVQHLQQQGKTVVFFANTTRVLGILAITDPIKDTSSAAIQTLFSRGMSVYMLTGDNVSSAQAVAQQVGISNVNAGMLPSDKADFVKELQRQGKTVAMVGDGINDSEALAQADVSIAMGHGSDIAMDVATITLTTSDLQAIPRALMLSSKTVRGIRQNLFWAFVYNLIGIPLAAGVLYPINGFLLDPMIAGAAMALSSVSVVANSLRLRKTKI